jgi:BASS family bile acid:Na+ symporter
LKKTTLIIFSFIGRHASYSLPVGVVIGLTIPLLAEWMRPFLVPALLVPLTLSLVRIPLNQIVTSLKRWQAVTILAFWILLVSPVMVWLILGLVTLPEPIALASLITAAAPPVTACAAIAVFLGLDAAIVVVATVVTMLLVPLTLPPVVIALAGMQVDVQLWQLSLRLAGFIFAAFAFALIIKKMLGQKRIDRQAALLDGISVMFISIFIIGLMRGVTDLAVRRPWFVFQTFAAATLLVLGLYVVSTVLFWRLGSRTAMAVGLISGNCNMGLMYLVLADQATLDLLIFFAIGQIPMYFLPSLLAPYISRVNTS